MSCADEIESGLFISGHHVDFNARAILNFIDRLLTVMSIAKGGGGEGGDASDAEVFKEVAIFADDLDDLFNARAQHNPLAHVRRQPHCMLLFHDHIYPVAVDQVNCHANRI